MKNNGKSPNAYVVWVVCCVTFLLSVSGMTWGRVESWDPDQMAFFNLFVVKSQPFNPKWFLKPPFHAYFHYFLSVLPTELIQSAFNLPRVHVLGLRLLWSRFLALGQFLGSVYLVYSMVKTEYGKRTGQIVALLLSTSAGLIFYIQTLTTDIPLVFWCVVSVYFCFAFYKQKKASLLMLAGLFIGVAAATKYNGLIVMGSLLVAYISVYGKTIRGFLRNIWILLAGCFFIIAAFITVNPYAILDYGKFSQDFTYNLVTDKYYAGKMNSNSFLVFISFFADTVGLPNAILLGIGLLFCFYQIMKKRDNSVLPYLSLSFIIPYYVYFGAYPVLWPRYVFPVAPFVFMLLGPFVRKHQYSKALLSFIVVAYAYNCVNLAYQGHVLRNEPRMRSQEWVFMNMHRNSRVLAYPYSPDWNALLNDAVHETKVPLISGRNRLFRSVFRNNSMVLGAIEQFEEGDDIERWFTLQGVMNINPDFITVNSMYYGRFFMSDYAEKYPEVRSYFKDLLNEKFPYKVIFHDKTSPFPWWVYPKYLYRILDNQMVILQKTSAVRNSFPQE